MSEFPSAGIIGLGLSVSTIHLETVLGDRPDDFDDVLPGFKLKWPKNNKKKHANQRVGIHLIAQESRQVQFTLEGIQPQADFCFLNLDKLNIGPASLKRLRLTPSEFSSDPPKVIYYSVAHLNAKKIRPYQHDGPLPAI